MVGRAPRVAHRRVGDRVEEVPVEALSVGDHVLVRQGEVVPVDGLVMSGEAVLDESALSGEALPVSYKQGAPVRSGTANAGEAFELRATRPASESAYAGVVRLVRQAESHKAPFVRMADRYAAFFLPVTLVAAGVAWALSGDPVRGLAVLVVATPCPLILAAPVAILSGVSRAARAGVIVKGGAAIEQLGEARTVILDKTGTLTLGTPEIEQLVPFGGSDGTEMLRLAASVDQLSAHSLAEALVLGARRRGLDLSFPEEVDEGLVRVQRAWWTVAAWRSGANRGWRTRLSRTARSHARARWGERGRPRQDPRRRRASPSRRDHHGRPPSPRCEGARGRPESGRHPPRRDGNRRSRGGRGGHRARRRRRPCVRRAIPARKLELVRSIQQDAELRPVVMVGDGVNDAPALALADVGIAMGTAGATVASETADAVILVDRIGRVADAVRIGQRSLSIARQSVLAGIGLSLVAMGFAAFGFIPPVYGALLQEGIDVAVILNALRALHG